MKSISNIFPPEKQAYTIYIECDAAGTGTITRKEWRKEGKPHRENGPAVIERDAYTGGVTREEWWKDGKLEAAIRRDPYTRAVTGVTWPAASVEPRSPKPMLPSIL